MSSTTTNTTYLITGVNRGIGKGLLTTYLSRPSTTTIACVRDPSSAASTALSDLPKGHGSKLIVVKIDSGSETDAAAAVTSLQSDHGISKVDVVIANAGVATHFGTVATTPLAEVRSHFAINAVGPVVLFQAVLPLLQAAPRPKFVVVSSNGGSIGGMRGEPIGAYGASKAMVNYFVRKIHFENEWLIAFPLHPGFVQTDMGAVGAKAFGLVDGAPTTVKESVDGLVALIDGATREKTSGHFFRFDGMELLW